MEKTDIHPSAFVHPDAVVGEGTRVGPFAIVEAKVTLGRGCHIQEHAIVRDHCVLGDEVNVHPFAVVGGPPQHLRYQGEPTRVEIGDGVTLREYVTVNRGTEFGNKVTRIESGAYLMAYCHVAHDCEVGPGVILANSVQLAGHVRLGKGVVIGGVSAVTQFCALGDYCFVGGGSLVRKDLPPYLSGKGNDFEVQGVNTVGLQRQGLSPQTIRSLRQVYKVFYLQNRTVADALESVPAAYLEFAEVRAFVEFIRTSKQGIAR